MQGTWVRSLVWEDSTEQLDPCTTGNEATTEACEPVLRNKRSRCSEKPPAPQPEVASARHNGRKAHTATKIRHSQKKKKNEYTLKKKVNG